MLTYEPGDSVVHRFDPRSKLVGQFGLAIAAFSLPHPAWLAGLFALSLAAVLASHLSPIRVLIAYRYVFLFLAFAPLVAGVALGPPWFRPGPAADSLLAVSRVVPVLFASGAFVYTTPVRGTRAAIQRHLPGRVGQSLGIGVGLVLRFFPVVLADVRRIRNAIRARGGERRSVRDRARRVAVLGLSRAFDRSERLSLALRARCFAWNPTLPDLRFSWYDYPVLLAGLGLALTPLVPVAVAWL